MKRLEHVAMVAMMAIASLATVATSPLRTAWTTTAPVKEGRRPVVLTAAVPEQRLRIRFEVSAGGRLTTKEVPEILAQLRIRAPWSHEGPAPQADLLSLSFEPKDVSTSRAFIPLGPQEEPHANMPLEDTARWTVAGTNPVCPKPPGPCVLEATAVFAWDGERTGTVTLRPDVELVLTGPSYGKKQQPLPAGAEIRLLEAQWLGAPAPKPTVE